MNAMNGEAVLGRHVDVDAFGAPAEVYSLVCEEDFASQQKLDCEIGMTIEEAMRLIQGRTSQRWIYHHFH